jgi:hypothetical protein
MKNPVPLILALALCHGPPAPAAVRFTVQFEPGSKWFTETWSTAARTEMLAYFSDLGLLFTGDAEVVVEVNDNETSAYASAGATWTAPTTVEGRAGTFFAPSVWSILVKGVDQNGSGPDVRINWNLDVAALYSGSSAQMIGNIRGLARHEMHHPFGSSSYLFQSSTYDPRGRTTPGALIDAFYRDLNDAPLLGAYNPTTQRFTVNAYTLAPNWNTVSNQSGLYFEARDLRGEIVKMPPISYSGQIDFSHVTGIAYVNDHPSWRNYETTDFNFLRALGYPLAVDAALTQRAPVTDFRLAGGNAQITCATLATRNYRLSTSRDLKRWIVRPQGIRGTDAPLLFQLPATDPQQFYRVVEIPR